MFQCGKELYAECIWGILPKENVKRKDPDLKTFKEQWGSGKVIER